MQTATFEQDFSEDPKTRGERSGWTSQWLGTMPARTHVLPTSTFDGFEATAKVCVPCQVYFATGDPHLRKQKKQLVDFDRTTCQNLLQAMSFEARRQTLEKGFTILHVANDSSRENNACRDNEDRVSSQSRERHLTEQCCARRGNSDYALKTAVRRKLFSPNPFDTHTQLSGLTSKSHMCHMSMFTSDSIFDLLVRANL